MTKKRTAFLTLITASLAVMANHAHAQYAPAGQTASAKEAPCMSFEDKLASVTGRRYWIEVNPQSIYKLKFYENVPTEGWGDLEFELTQTRSFTVDSFVHSPKGMQVRVRFDDGKVGYIAMNLSFPLARDEPLFYHEYANGGTYPGPEEKILPMPPAELHAQLVAQQRLSEAAAAILLARPAVRLGMTGPEVRSSGWGSPESVSRTTSSIGVHETWLYRRGTFLTLLNGRVTVIHE